MRFRRRREAESEDSTPLVRTWFGNDEAWETLLASVRRPSEDGFIATVSVVNDQARAGAAPSVLAAMLSSQDEYSIVVAADERAMTEPEMALLVILADGSDQPQTLRVVCSELWGIENNIRLANMEWESFVQAADGDGVFRGFAQ